MNLTKAPFGEQLHPRVTFFELFNAPANASPATVSFALFCADRLILAIPLALVATWLWGDRARRESAVRATLAAFIALGVGQILALHYVPRPFAAGVGHTLMAHVADSSFPSDHATALAAVGFSLALEPRTRFMGLLVAALWFPVSWARVYLGVHFPSDLIGGACLGLATAFLVKRTDDFLVQPITGRLQQLYAIVAAPLIRWRLVK